MKRMAAVLASAVAISVAGCNSERLAEPMPIAEKEQIGKEFRQAQREAKEARKAGIMKSKGPLKQKGASGPSEP